MCCLVVVARHRLNNGDIVSVVHYRGVRNFMTVFVVVNIRFHVCLIMAQVLWFWVGIPCRESIPVVRRVPRIVSYRTAEIREQRRFLYKHRLNDILFAVNIWVTYYLAIYGLPHFECEGSYILEHIVCQYSLNYKDVVVGVDNLHDSQVINKTIVIKVKV